jgi:hypothetical protein
VWLWLGFLCYRVPSLWSRWWLMPLIMSRTPTTADPPPPPGLARSPKCGRAMNGLPVLLADRSRAPRCPSLLLGDARARARGVSCDRAPDRAPARRVAPGGKLGRRPGESSSPAGAGRRRRVVHRAGGYASYTRG